MWQEASSGGTALVQVVARRFIVSKRVPEHLNVLVIENATEMTLFYLYKHCPMTLHINFVIRFDVTFT